MGGIGEIGNMGVMGSIGFIGTSLFFPFFLSPIFPSNPYFPYYSYPLSASNLKKAAPPPCLGKKRLSSRDPFLLCWQGFPYRVILSSYTSSGDSHRNETMLNFLPNALFTALSSVSSSAPLFMLIFLTGVSGLLTGST